MRLLIYLQRRQVTILMLHGVNNPEIPTKWEPLRSHLSTSQLERTISFLSRYYKFISLTEASEIITGNRVSIPNALVLTFDDGYLNNLTYAIPILHRYKAPASIFLSTNNVTNQQPFWFDRLDYAIQSINDCSFLHEKHPEITMLDFSSRETLRNTFISYIRQEKKRYSTNESLRNAISQLIERIENHSGSSLLDIYSHDSWSRIMSWNDVKETPHFVSFGSHCVDHPILGITNKDKAYEELFFSRQLIEFHTGLPCEHLAYPDGSFNGSVIDATRKCKYVVGLTTIRGRNKQGDEMLSLKRISFPSDLNPALTLSSITGITSLFQWK